MFFPLTLSNVPSQQPGRRGSHVEILDSLEFHARMCQCEKWPPLPPGCFPSSHVLLCLHHEGLCTHVCGHLAHTSKYMPSHFTNSRPFRSSSDLGEYTPTSSQKTAREFVQVIPGSQIPGWPKREDGVMCPRWACPPDPIKSLLYKKKEHPCGALDYFLCI